MASRVDKLRTRFGLQRVILVGDRGMLTAARIREDLQGVDGLRWIIDEQAHHMRGLINDLLDAGRIETGALSVAREAPPRGARRRSVRSAR